MARYQDLAFRAAYLVLRDAAEAEDAAQDAFVKAYAALGRFRPGAPFRPWMLRIVTNEARNRHKAASRRASLALHVGQGNPSNAVPSPEAAVVGNEQRELLLTVLESLREEDRRVIAYRYFLDLSESEMAESMGCAVGTVKSRLARALARLRERVTATDLVRDAGGGRQDR